ncbi:hypothetical protein L211DRAFT_264038 [Terfezia boudieri ATCC MYA-4762]|uniref:Uncharacterized protein n=1 Tax=Terfezia boudieri ATCC MYA-4762 TaxID=1051890 RepID=A0A3N4M5X8_9PEZI|nr:hypothetical protein L211DRAFT_264038 [Terfezia boudieri ATCC MYA-4762]
MPAYESHHFRMRVWRCRRSWTHRCRVAIIGLECLPIDQHFYGFAGALCCQLVLISHHTLSAELRPSIFMDLVAEVRGPFAMHPEPACFPFIQISCPTEAVSKKFTVPIMWSVFHSSVAGLVRRRHGRRLSYIQSASTHYESDTEG